MLDTDVAWAAGFLDGEGYFGLDIARTSGQVQAVVAASQNNPAPLEKLQGLFGGNYMLITPKKGNPHYYWRVRSTALERMLDVIEPHLVGKRDLVPLLKEFFVLRQTHPLQNHFEENFPKYIDLYWRVRNVNARWNTRGRAEGSK